MDPRCEGREANLGGRGRQRDRVVEATRGHPGGRAPRPPGGNRPRRRRTRRHIGGTWGPGHGVGVPVLRPARPVRRARAWAPRPRDPPRVGEPATRVARPHAARPPVQAATCATPRSRAVSHRGRGRSFGGGRRTAGETAHERRHGTAPCARVPAPRCRRGAPLRPDRDRYRRTAGPASCRWTRVFCSVRNDAVGCGARHRERAAAGAGSRAGRRADAARARPRAAPPAVAREVASRSSRLSARAPCVAAATAAGHGATPRPA